MKQSEDSVLSSIYSHRWTAEERAKMKEVWRVLVDGWFQKFIKPDAVVLDLGAGFCGFINTVRAKSKIALDANPRFVEFADEDVETFVTDDLSLPMIGDGTVTHIFLSNFLEHLPDSGSIIDLLRVLRRKLRPDGSILILQPNFRLVGAAYFDFIDHHVVLTDKSLVEALETTGFTATFIKKRFLPYTSKSSLPKSPMLVKIYLKIPILQHIFGGQTFVVAKKTES